MLMTGAHRRAAQRRLARSSGNVREGLRAEKKRRVSTTRRGK
jgi:hypothetical protein